MMLFAKNKVKSNKAGIQVVRSGEFTDAIVHLLSIPNAPIQLNVNYNGIVVDETIVKKGNDTQYRSIILKYSSYGLAFWLSVDGRHSPDYNPCKLTFFWGNHDIMGDRNNPTFRVYPVTQCSYHVDLNMQLGRTSEVAAVITPILLNLFGSELMSGNLADNYAMRVKSEELCNQIINSQYNQIFKIKGLWQLG